MFKFWNNPLFDEAGADGAMGGGVGGGTGDGTGGDSTALATVDTGTDLATAGDTDLATTEDAPAGGETRVSKIWDKAGRPSKEFRTALAPLGKQSSEIYHAVGTVQKLKRMFPGGIMQGVQGLQQRLQTVTTQIKELGGADTVEKALDQIRYDLHSVQELDRLYAHGDPKMIEQMTETPDGKASFAKIMPSALDKWRALTPNAFAAYFGQTIIATMRNSLKLGTKENPLDVNFLWDMQDLARYTPRTVQGVDAEGKPAQIPNPAAQALAKLNAFMEHLQYLASLEPEKLAAPAADAGSDPLAEDRELLAKERRELNTEKLIDQEQKILNSVFSAHYNAATKGRTVTADQRVEIQAMVDGWMQLRLNANRSAHNEKLKQFAESGDRQGHLRYVQGVYDRAYRELVPKAVRKELGTKRGPSSGGAGATAVTGAPDVGWQRITFQQLKTIGIDRSKTGMDLFMQGKAFGKDGKRYQFKNFEA